MTATGWSASRMSTCSTCGLAVMLRRARRGRMRERKIPAHLRGLKALGLEVTITPAAA
jgi:hypothetical protein